MGHGRGTDPRTRGRVGEAYSTISTRALADRMGGMMALPALPMAKECDTQTALSASATARVAVPEAGVPVPASQEPGPSPR